jgi:hypothetical protein
MGAKSAAVIERFEPLDFLSLPKSGKSRPALLIGLS